MTILIADDEKNILTLESKLLSRCGYNILTAENGAEALDIYYDKHIDMLICDEMMPEMTGNELVSEIRKDDPSLPIIMLTAKSSTVDKGISFSLGVDDYIVKPLDGDELIMRVGAIFRRAKINTDNKITVGDVVLDADTHTVTAETRGEAITLTKTEFDILFKLLAYPEKSFTKWQIFNEFWGPGSDTDDNIVKVYISKIRKQIEIFPELEIKTVMGVGYRGVRNG